MLYHAFLWNLGTKTSFYGFTKLNDDEEFSTQMNVLIRKKRTDEQIFKSIF